MNGTQKRRSPGNRGSITLWRVRASRPSIRPRARQELEHAPPPGGRAGGASPALGAGRAGGPAGGQFAHGVHVAVHALAPGRPHHHRWHRERRPPARQHRGGAQGPPASWHLRRGDPAVGVARTDQRAAGARAPGTSPRGRGEGRKKRRSPAPCATPSPGSARAGTRSSPQGLVRSSQPARVRRLRSERT